MPSVFALVSVADRDRLKRVSEMAQKVNKGQLQPQEAHERSQQVADERLQKLPERSAAPTGSKPHPAAPAGSKPHPAAPTGSKPLPSDLNVTKALPSGLNVSKSLSVGSTLLPPPSPSPPLGASHYKADTLAGISPEGNCWIGPL